MHDFTRDFYGAHLNLVMLGFIRPEYDYVSVDSLIDDIRTDIAVARASLERPPPWHRPPKQRGFSRSALRHTKAH